MRITAPGIYPEIASADYFADPCPTPSLTQSICKTLLDYSPAHARLEHPRLVPPNAADDEPEKYVVAQAIGNAAHKIMIGRGKDIAIGEFDNWMKGDAREFKAGALAAGRTPILEKHHERAREMVKAASFQLEAAGLREAFRVGQGEVMVAAEVDGVWCRCLIDWMVDATMLYDFKTSAQSCAPHALDVKVAADGWDIQAAMQERCLDAVDPKNAGRRRFRFVAQENEPPFALTVVELPESVMTMGRKKLDMATMVWRVCMANNVWPAYPTDIHIASYPGWAEKRWLDREMSHHERHDRERTPVDILMGG